MLSGVLVAVKKEGGREGGREGLEGERGTELGIRVSRFYSISSLIIDEMSCGQILLVTMHGIHQAVKTR